MLAHLQAVYPEEGCGLLSGSVAMVATAHHAIENRLHSPTAFEMEPRQQIQVFLAIEACGEMVLAMYHSHPHGPTHPSPTDMTGAYYPEIPQIIVSLAKLDSPIVKAFWLTTDAFTELPWQMV